MIDLSHIESPIDIPVSLPLLPKPNGDGLSQTYQGLDQDHQVISVSLVTERAWTIYFNRHEIVSMMTIGDQPVLLTLGYLANQQLLPEDLSQIISIEVDDELCVVVLRTIDSASSPNLSRRIRTSGCGEGTMFEHVMAGICDVQLCSDARISLSDIQNLLKKINSTPSLYLSAGAIHGCALCRKDSVLAYVEDIGRHNAIDKIAGIMLVNGLAGSDHIFFTTGRLTTEMVLKAIQMRIPIIVSRSGFTAAAVELAREADLTLIGRAKGKRFELFSASYRVLFTAQKAKSDV